MYVYQSLLELITLVTTYILSREAYIALVYSREFWSSAFYARYMCIYSRYKIFPFPFLLMLSADRRRRRRLS